MSASKELWEELKLQNSTKLFQIVFLLLHYRESGRLTLGRIDDSGLPACIHPKETR